MSGCSSRGSSRSTAPSASIPSTAPLSAVLPTTGDLGILAQGLAWASTDRSFGSSAPSRCDSGAGDEAAVERIFTAGDPAAPSTVELSIITKTSSADAQAEINDKRGPTYRNCFRMQLVSDASAAGSGIDLKSVEFNSTSGLDGGEGFTFSVQMNNSSCVRHHDDYFVALGRYVLFADFGGCGPYPLTAERSLISAVGSKLSSQT